MLNMQNNMQNNSSLFIFCIFGISEYAEYAEYVKKYASICRCICWICKIICKIIVHCSYSAYSAYCNMLNMKNMPWYDFCIFCILLHIAAYFLPISAHFQKYGEICPFDWCKALMSSQYAGISFGIFQNQPSSRRCGWIQTDAVISMSFSSFLHLEGVDILFKFMNYICQICRICQIWRICPIRRIFWIWTNCH
jgi:hypothetical protein